MLIKSKLFKEACSKILYAIDKEGDIQGNLTDVVELQIKENTLYLNTTNKEYYVSLKFPMESTNEETSFKATVNAGVFLKLISQITTENIELNIKDRFLSVNANGNYKIPLIYDNDSIMELPEINIYNPTVQMTLDTEILRSILHYNSKELSKGTIVNSAIQRLHYIDDQGALTFTTGACVNNFILPKKINILLNNKIVKLFKLLDEDEVSFTLGYDSLSEDLVQTKIKIETPTTVISAILNCDNSLLKQVPVEKIRERANTPSKYNVSINKNSLLQALNRMLIFINNNKSKPVAFFKFTKDNLEIMDLNKENSEDISIQGFEGEEYIALLDISDLKLTIETCVEQYLNLSFGDEEAFLITRLNIINILPECGLL